MKRLDVVLSAIAILISVGIARPTAAQDTIITDRPDFTESGISVPAGTVQVEGGFSLVDDGNVSFFNLPETLVRVGLIEGLELRIGVPDYEDRESVSGIGDLSVGGKLEIDDILEDWQTAAILTLELPTGEEGIGSDHLSLEGILAGGTDINDVYSLGAQVSAGIIGTDGGTDFELGGTIVVARPIAESLGSFLELAALIPEVGEMELILHTGLTYLVQNNLQLDLHLGVGLTEESPNSIVGGGFAIIL